MVIVLDPQKPEVQRLPSILSREERNKLEEVMRALYPKVKITQYGDSYTFYIILTDAVSKSETIPLAEIIFYILPRKMHMENVIINTNFPRTVLTQMFDRYDELNRIEITKLEHDD